MSGNLGNTKTSKWTVSQLAGMQGITDDEYIAKQKEENRKKYLAQFAGIDGFGSADTRYMSYPLSRSAQENTGDTLRISCLEYVAPTNGGGNFGVEIKNKYITQNFANGKTKYLLNTKANQIANNKTRKASGLEETTYKDMELSTTFTDANTRINSLKTHKYYIELPMPQEVADQNAVTWGDDRMNAIEIAGLAIAQDIMAGGGSSGDGSRVQRSQEAIRAFLEGVNIDGLNSQTTNAIRAAISGAAVGALGSNVSPSSVIARSTGQILNNNLELLFQGLNLRTKSRGEEIDLQLKILQGDISDNITSIFEKKKSINKMLELVNDNESTIDLVPLTKPILPLNSTILLIAILDKLHSSDLVKAIIGLCALIFFHVFSIISVEDPLCKHKIEHILLSPCLSSRLSII